MKSDIKIAEYVRNRVEALEDVPARRQSHKNSKRREKRKKSIEEQGHVATKHMIFEHIQLADPIASTLDLKSLPAASGAYCGKTLDSTKIDRSRAYSSEELQCDHGFRLLEYNEK